MRYAFLFWGFWMTTSFSVFAQSQDSERHDTTLSVFWNPDVKVRIRILRPEEEDIRKNNAVVTIHHLQTGTQRSLYTDSLFAYTLLFKMTDMNGDGIKDLLVYHTNNGEENRSYHLYLVDQTGEKLTRVKKFEKIYNPQYDQQKCLIIGFEMYDKRIMLRYYQVDKKGNLSIIVK